MTKSKVDEFWPIREISARSSVENADNGWLGELGGMVDVSMVNGACAREVPEFRPTEHELFTLVGYWSETIIAIEYSWFLNKTALGSTGLQRRFALERLRRIRTILGAEVDTVIERAIHRYGAKQDRLEWEAFLYRSEEGQNVL